MTVEHFFRLVWRFNALAFAIACCLALVLGVYGLVQIARYETRTVTAGSVTRIDPGSGPTTFAIGQFSWLDAGSTMWAPVEATQRYASGYHAKEAGSVRNYVVFDVAKGTSRQILADNASNILQAQPVRPNRSGDRTGDAPARAIFLRLVSGDSNGDGRLSLRDESAIGLARPDGSGFTRLPLTVRSATLAGLSDEGSVLVMVTTEKGAEALSISLDSFEITRRTTIVTGQP